MVAVEVRETGRSIPIRDAMLSLPLLRQGDGGGRRSPGRQAAQAADRGGRFRPRGDEACASGWDPWFGVRTRADPARWHGEATARRQKGRGDAEPAADEDRLRRETALRGGSRVTRTAHRAIGEHVGGWPRNAMNPRVGSGMQQAHGRRNGGTRRGGVRPRGRTETS